MRGVGIIILKMKTGATEDLDFMRTENGKEFGRSSKS